MKNLPEDELFSELQKRLSNYSEEPDDELWNKIAVELHPERDRQFWFWFDRTAATVALIVLGWLSFIAVFHTGENVERMQANKTVHTQEKIAKEPTQIHEIIDAHPQELAGHEPAMQQHTSDNLMKQSSIIERNDAEIHRGKTGDTAIDERTQPWLAIQSWKIELANVNPGLPQKKVTRDKTVADIKREAESLKEKRESEKKNRKYGLKMYGSVSPALSYQRLLPNADDAVIIDDVQAVPVLSVKRFGWKADIGVQGTITPKLEFYTGLSLYQQSQQLTYFYRSEENPHIDRSDNMMYVVSPTEASGTFDYSMVNAGVDAGLLYQLGTYKSLAHKIGAGISYQHGLRRSNKEQYVNSQSQYLFYQFFYRSEYTLSRRMSVYVQPAFSQTLWLDEQLHSPFKLKPYRGSISFGATWHF